IRATARTGSRCRTTRSCRRGRPPTRSRTATEAGISEAGGGASVSRAAPRSWSRRAPRRPSSPAPGKRTLYVGGEAFRSLGGGAAENGCSVNQAFYGVDALCSLFERIRIAQWDILDFTRNPDDRELRFPQDYWLARSAKVTE